MSVKQAATPKVVVSPLELEDPVEPPLNLYKPKGPYIATIVSVERIVGPKAPGETCHLSYWEGQSFGIIPPVTSSVFQLYFQTVYTLTSCFCLVV